MPAQPAAAPPIAHRSPGTYGWTVVALMSTAAFINYLDRSSIGVAMPAMRGELHLDAHQQGQAFAAVLWTYTFMQLPMGWMIDRFNIKWLYTISFALWSLAAAATGLVHSFGILLLSRVLLGVGEAVYLPGGLRVISESFAPEQRALPSGVFDLGAKFGIAAGIFIDAWILLHWGWRSLFFRTGTFGLLWLIPWLLLYSSRRSSGKKRAPVRWKELFSNRTVWAISIGFFAWDYFWYLLVFWLPSYLHDVRHFDFIQLKSVAALPFVVVGIAEAIGGFLPSVLQRRGYSLTTSVKAVIALGFVLALLIIPAAYVHSRSAAVLLICAVSLCGVLIPATLLVPQYCAPFEQIALWVGIQNFWGNVGGIIAPDLTGYLIKRTGSYLPGFFCAALVLLLGLFAYLFILQRLELGTSASEIDD